MICEIIYRNIAWIKSILNLVKVMYLIIESWGMYTWTDGKYYEVELVQNKMHGKGKFVWPDGKSYEENM